MALPKEISGQRTAGKVNSRADSLTSVIASDLSHQPSNEFIERLELNQKQKEAYSGDQHSENNLDHLQFAIEDPHGYRSKKS